jgi:copper chaperone NosL
MLLQETSETVVLKFVVPAIIAILFATAVFAAGPEPTALSAKDKCPVCGMFVAKYPDFSAQIHFRDGSHTVFDGVKDMFKFYGNLSHYAAGRKEADITAIYVTNYYTLKLIDGYKAYYVSGSDVFGPMGKELVPFDKKADAQEFLKDHKGKSILTFRDINSSVVNSLE